MQINSNLPLQFLNNPQPNQEHQAGNAAGAPHSNATHPSAAVNPSSQTQVAQHAQDSEGTESASARAQEASKGSEGSRLDVFA